MKVIHSNRYRLAGLENGWLKFISNPELKDYDDEIIYVKRARYVVRRGDVFYSNILDVTRPNVAELVQLIGK